jgi:hypothetical protein
MGHRNTSCDPHLHLSHQATNAALPHAKRPPHGRLRPNAVTVQVKSDRASMSAYATNLELVTYLEQVASRIVGSEEARLRASLRPPPKLHVRFARMQLSRRHMT